MPADRSAAPVAPTEGTDAADADRGRFVFGADPARDRWWGRPLKLYGASSWRASSPTRSGTGRASRTATAGPSS